MTTTNIPPVQYPAQQIIVVQKTGNGLATSSMTLGIIGSVVGLIPLFAVPALICGLLALPFGLIGLSAAKKDPARSGRGRAIAGIVLALVALTLAIIGFAIVANAFK